MKDTITCRGCGTSWQHETKNDLPASYSGECKPCSEKRRLKSFELLCPPLYLDTDVARLPKDKLASVMKWKYGSHGLIMFGDTGKGKTRSAWTLLKRVLVQDVPEQKFLWFDCIGFGHEITRQFKQDSAEDWADAVANVPILFFDDLGKLKMTERAEVELFGVVERRIANKLPLIVTMNATADAWSGQMTDNRGPALIRRLREFCEPIQF